MTQRRGDATLVHCAERGHLERQLTLRDVLWREES